MPWQLCTTGLSTGKGYAESALIESKDSIDFGVVSVHFVFVGAVWRDHQFLTLTILKRLYLTPSPVPDFRREVSFTSGLDT